MNKLIFIPLCFLVYGCAPILRWQSEFPDNEIEKLVEQFIKDKLDIDVDLTPVSGKERQKF